MGMITQLLEKDLSNPRSRGSIKLKASKHGQPVPELHSLEFEEKSTCRLSILGMSLTCGAEGNKYRLGKCVEITSPSSSTPFINAPTAPR